MNVSNILSLPQVGLDYIYHFLGSNTKSKKCFSLTCSFFYHLSIENDEYINLEKYLKKKFKIIDTNFSKLPLWIILKHAQVILCGEIHTEDWQRKKLSQLINKISLNNDCFSLFTEGDYELGTGQLKYLHKDIAVTGENWDLEEDFDWEHYAQIVEKTFMKMLRLSSCFFKVRDELNSSKILPQLLEIFDVLKENLPIDHRQLIHKELTNLQKSHLFKANLDVELKTVNSKIFKNLKLDQENLFNCRKLYAMFLICLEITSQIEYDIVKQERSGDAIRPKRERNMINKILNKINLNRKVIVMAGLNHVIALRDDSPIAVLKKRRIKFLSIKAKKRQKPALTVSQKSVKKLKNEAREELKNLDVTSLVDWDDIYSFIRYNPLQVLKKELNSCLNEYQEYCKFLRDKCQASAPKNLSK